MTAAVESLHRQYPGEFITGVQTTCQEIWRFNPRITLGMTAYESQIIMMGYPLINQSDKAPCHFMAGFTEDLGRQLGIPLALQINHPCLYLHTSELVPPDLPRPYVLVNAGVKSDFTCKGAGRETYQEIVDHFKGRLTFIQIGEANPSHFHKPLDNAINMIGQTNPRQLFRLAYHSVCGVGPVTFLHHIYAAFQKPYVCYLGGREPGTWEYYPTAVMLDTLGQLPCCRTRACWKSRVVALNDGSKNDGSLCSLPVLKGGEMIPKCMELLGSAPAIKAIENMIDTGVISV